MTDALVIAGLLASVCALLALRLARRNDANEIADGDWPHTPWLTWRNRLDDGE